MIKKILLTIFFIFLLLNLNKNNCNKKGSIAEKINFANKSCPK